MIEIVITFAIIFLGLIVYKVWIKPIKLMNHYAKCFRDKGYKVFRMPYHPLNVHFQYIVRKGIQQGDAMKLYKQDFQGYDVIIGNFFLSPQIDILHPDLIKQYYSVDKHYEYPKVQFIANIFAVIGLGLIFREGAQWKRKRNIFNKIFNFDFVKSLAPKISEICTEAIKDMQSQGKKNDSQNLEKQITYNILDLTVQMYSQVMLNNFLLGTKNQTIMGEPVTHFLKNLFSQLNQYFFIPINVLLGPKFLKLGITKKQRSLLQKVEAYRKWGIQFIRRRLKQIQQKLDKEKDLSKIEVRDVIEALIVAKRTAASQNQSGQFQLSAEQILDQFNGFFLAGTDTTTTFTQMMIYYIALYPQVEAKVRQEIQKYMGNEDYSYENLKNLKYIDNLQKQVTRHYGPATHLFGRCAKVDNYFNGVPISKGTKLQITHFVNLYSQKYFKNPKQFRPQRWDNQCNDLHPFAMVGFSAGARVCIGKSLALIQNKIGIIKFMKRYKKITLPKQNFKMVFKFLYIPQKFDTKLTINQDYNL